MPRSGLLALLTSVFLVVRSADVQQYDAIVLAEEENWELRNEFQSDKDRGPFRCALACLADDEDAPGSCTAFRHVYQDDSCPVEGLVRASCTIKSCRLGSISNCTLAGSMRKKEKVAQLAVFSPTVNSSTVTTLTLGAPCQMKSPEIPELNVSSPLLLTGFSEGILACSTLDRSCFRWTSADNTWEDVEPMTFGHSLAVTVVIGSDVVFVAGGRDDDGAHGKSEALVNGTWQEKADFPKSIYGHASVSVGALVYTFGGAIDDLISNEVYCYDYDNDTWTHKKSATAYHTQGTGVTCGLSNLDGKKAILCVTNDEVEAFFVDSETWQVLDARYKWAPRVFGHFHGDQHGFYYIGGMRIDLKHVKKMNDVDYLDLNELQWSRRHRLEGVKEDLPHISAVVYEAEIVGCANARFSPTTFYDSDKMKLASPALYLVDMDMAGLYLDAIKPLNPATQCPLRRKALPNTGAGTMNYRASSLITFRNGILCCGFRGGEGKICRHWKFGADSWTTAPTMDRPHARGLVKITEDTALAVGNSPPSKDVEFLNREYWEVRESLPDSVEDPELIVTSENMVYLFGTSSSSYVYKYDVNLDHWTALPRLPDTIKNRPSCGLVLKQGQQVILCSGGDVQDKDAALMAFDVRTETWQLVMALAKDSFTKFYRAFGTGDKFYLFSDHSISTGDHNKILVYDAATDEWSDLHPPVQLGRHDLGVGTVIISLQFFISVE